MNNNNFVVGIVVVVVIVLVGIVMYSQGYLGGAKDNEQDVEINLPGGNETPNNY